LNNLRLTKLDLSGCFDIAVTTFLTLTKHHENLKELNLAGCPKLFYGLDQAQGQAINDRFKGLHTLNLAGTGHLLPRTIFQDVPP